MNTAKIVETPFSRPPVLRLQNLIKLYAHQPAVRDISLTAQQGQILALVGPSGCGKTTLLRLIAGLEAPDSGEIRLDNRLVSSPARLVPPHQRGVGMVFQDLALWPHLTARQQLSFALGRITKAEKKERIAETLELVRLPRPDSYPHQLSGGEQQRLALARALAPRPRVLLFDEPLSNLDPELKLELLPEIKGLLRRLQITAVYVTHQWEEAEYLADTVASMHSGQLVQLFTGAEFSEEIGRRTRSVLNPGKRTPHLTAKVLRIMK